MKTNTIEIHGKMYMPVNERVKEAHADNKEMFSVTTELVVTSDSHIVFKATVVTKKGTFTGTSSVDSTSSKLIEKQNPYEVAETSAVGRALGFAGYGIVDSIASADEMHKSSYQSQETQSNVASNGNGTYKPTEKQLAMILKLLTEKGYAEEQLLQKYEVTKLEDLSGEQASTIIGNLIKLPKVA